MPEGTKVHSCVQDLVKQGHSKGSAIRICQKSTGQAYATGKAPKHQKHRTKRWYQSQYKRKK